MASASEILSTIYQQVELSLEDALIADDEVLARIQYICRCLSNRAGVRLLMACMLGKIEQPSGTHGSHTLRLAEKNAFPEEGSTSATSPTSSRHIAFPAIQPRRSSPLPCEISIMCLRQILRSWVGPIEYIVTPYNCWMTLPMPESRLKMYWPTQFDFSSR